MYLGQESWARQGKGQQQSQQQWSQQPRQQQGQSMQQQMQRQQQMQQQHMQQQSWGSPAGKGGGGGGGGAGEVGSAQRVSITGCKHEVVGPIIRGEYTLAQMNHGKPAYKKEAGANGLTVMIYFWDERDGAASSGWWIGPQIGGNMVWGHHPNRTSATPPTNGWQAPHSAPADPSMVLNTPGHGGGAAAGGKGGYGQQQSNGYQQQQQQQMQQHRQQQMQVQQMQQKQQMEEQRKRMEEANRKRLEEQQRKIEIQKKQQEEQQRKRMEEIRKQQGEQKAVMSLRKTISKLKSVTPDTFAQLKEELAQQLAQELDACGSQKTKVNEESDKALEAAAEKVKAIEEQRKKNEERMKEMEKKKQEAQAKAKELVAELVTLVDAAEEVTKSFHESATTFLENKSLKTEAKISAAADPVEESGKAASEKVQQCLEFLRTKGNDMKALPVVVKKPGEESTDEEQPSVPKLSQRVGACKTGVDKDLKAFKDARSAALSKAAATKVTEKIKADFKKYDKNNDGMLDRKEIEAYAKGEFKFAVPKDTLDLIFKVIVAEGGKGVKADDFQRLKAAVGVARERSKDLDRQKARVAHEEALAKQKEKLQKVVDEVLVVVKKAQVEGEEVSKATRTLPTEGLKMKAPAMLERANEIEALVKSATEQEEGSKKEVEGLGEGVEVEKELKMWFDNEKRKLQMAGKAVDAVISKGSAALTKFREQAAKKDKDEVKVLSTKAMAKLRAYQGEKKLSPADVFAEIAKGKESFDKAAYVAFMKNIPAKAEEGKEAEELTEEDLERAFATLDEEQEGTVSKDVLTCLLRLMMKVVKDVAVTEDLTIKDSKLVRRLEVGEAVEVLEGPTKEDQADVTRVRAKTMKDGLEGWITVSGNQGSIFLKEGGATFKVIKDTILTEAFDIEATKEDTRSIKQSTRKLKPGEILEVREWEKKQEDTGLTRFKCKVRSDGLVGYVTTVGNTGIKFVEMV